MTESTLPNADLDLLTAAVDDPGTDLQDTLGVLADTLAAASPPCVGLTMTVVLHGVAVTLTAGDRDLAVTSPASLTLPLSILASNDPDSMVAFYAAPVGDLAAAVTSSAGGDRPIDQNHPAYPLTVSGLTEFSVRNQAIGVLIEQGHSPDEARIEIGRRATRNTRTLNQTALHILDNLAESPVSTRIDPLRPIGVGAQARRNPNLHPALLHVRAETSTARVARMRQPTSRARTGSTRGTNLTTPERAVLGLLVGGSSTAMIASTLHLVPRTVRNHTRAIMTKLGAGSRVETIAISLRKNILGTA